MYGSALLFESNEQFSEHLLARSENIKAAISDLFNRLPSASPDVQDLRRQLNELLAKEKDHAVELRKALDNQQSLDERLEAASERYMRAEKKLDRAKSTQVLKLERQAIMGGNGEASSPTTAKKSATPIRKDSEVNGDSENGAAGAEAEVAAKEALAIAEVQRVQAKQLEEDNERLTNQLSAARTQHASLVDDDYAGTSLFKTFKAQYEDVIKRVNDLEVTNVQLREEAQRLQAERTSYRIQIDEDNRSQSNDTEAQIARAETDLVRIRSVRDELISELNIRKSAEENRRTSADQARELAEARDSRIASLESELERLKLQLGESTAPPVSLEDLDNGALQAKVRTLESQYALLGNELSSMEAAWKKTSALASRKVEEISAQEEHLARLSAEKAKAEQKYFAAMKSKDMREGELRSLKSQNARSSEIVSQLKDTEGKTRELVTNLERQAAESRENLAKLETQHRVIDQKATEAGLVTEGLKKQVEELTAMVTTKDEDALAAVKAKREAEIELVKCQGRLEDTKKQAEVLRKHRAADNTASSDDWRVSRAAVPCSLHNANGLYRKSLSVPSATPISAIPCSRPADMSFVNRASRISFRIAHANVRAVGAPLGTMTTWELCFAERNGRGQVAAHAYIPRPRSPNLRPHHALFLEHASQQRCGAFALRCLSGRPSSPWTDEGKQ